MFDLRSSTSGQLICNARSEVGTPNNCYRRLVVAFGLTVAALCSSSKGSLADAAEATDTSYFLSNEFQVELSKAAGMDTAEFERQTTEKPTKRFGADGAISGLTEYMLWSPPSYKHLRGPKGGALKPSHIVRACRPEKTDTLEVVSIIRPSYITKLVVGLDGDKAMGMVEYHAPNAYKGTVGFGCSKSSGKWRVISFELDECGVRLVREGDQWSEKIDASTTNPKEEASR